MPSRILLISTNRCVTPERVFPLGLTYLQAGLRQEGHECRWLDLLDSPQGLRAELGSFRPDYVGLSVRNIDDVIIGKQETFYQGLGELSAAIRKELACCIILGGSGFSIFPEQLLELSKADFGIVGEGERSLPALLKALEQGRPYETIPGLVFRKANRVVINPQGAEPFEQEVLRNDWPEQVAARYLSSNGVLNVQTQRGCRFGCCYCTYPLIEGRRTRRRPAQLVAEEFAQLEALNAKYAFIVDSVFNSSARHVEQVCEAILSRGVKLSWGCFLRPQGLTAELMGLMVRAGLAHVEFGSDSFCDPVLQAYGKGFGFEDIRQASELAGRANVDCCHFLIAGGPGESQETLRQSFENSKLLGHATILAVVGMRLYPGTALHKLALAEGQSVVESELLAPRYYLGAGLSQEQLLEQLRGFAERSPNWIVGEPVAAYTKLVERLRQRGVVGPLWSYFSALQRLWPQAAEKSPPL